MYILGGKLKGKKLATCRNSQVRPAMALTRKSIFDILRDFTTHANVLDLCAGTGSLGIEALSRGASSLTLIDSDKNAIRLIRKNLTLCNVKAKTIFGKLPGVLNSKVFKQERFNLIFLDPPYGQSAFINKVLESLIQNELIAKDAIISIESEKKSNFQIPKELTLYKEKRYGNTKVSFLANPV